MIYSIYSTTFYTLPPLSLFVVIECKNIVGSISLRNKFRLITHCHNMHCVEF